MEARLQQLIAMLAPPFSAEHRIKALRRFAISNTILVALAHLVLGFEAPYMSPIVGVLAAYFAEIVLETCRAARAGENPGYVGGLQKFVDFLLSAHVIGLTASLFIHPGNSPWPTVFAAVVGVASKYLIRVPMRGHPNGRHFMNASNLGVMACFLCFPAYSLMVPWGFSSEVPNNLDWALPIVLFGLGTAIHFFFSHRLILINGFLISFTVQAVIRYFTVPDLSFIGLMGPATGPIAMLFLFFMAADPGTTPGKPMQQLIFGVSIGTLYGILTAAHLVYSLLWALLITCALRGLYEMAMFYSSGSQTPQATQGNGPNARAA